MIIVCTVILRAINPESGKLQDCVFSFDVEDLEIDDKIKYHIDKFKDKIKCDPS